jgi:uncharacterized flavoprotein (TIGR03862 family)
MIRIEHGVAVIGGGPAGLMAAEAAVAQGVRVHLFDAMPSVGRKFLLAGRGGLNLTHSEPLPRFLDRYGAAREALQPMLEAFPPDTVRAWAANLGIDTFTGTSGRVFPHDFKAAPLLRAWLRRLREAGVLLHARHRWRGFSGDGLLFGDGELVRADATVLALGGGSWPNLGSDGGWIAPLRAAGIAVAPLRPSNCGFEIAWPEPLAGGFDGLPLKNVGLSFGGRRLRGEVVLTTYGIEGGAVYALSAALRDAIECDSRAELILDLKNDLELAEVERRLSRPRGGASLSTWLRKTLNLPSGAAALLRGFAGEAVVDTAALAAAIKALPLPLAAPRPLAEAISSAGGVSLAAVDENLMLRDRPGVFVAGEMLDWEAPTGGYLLQACLSTGRWAGAAAARHITRQRPAAAAG